MIVSGMRIMMKPRWRMPLGYDKNISKVGEYMLRERVNFVVIIAIMLVFLDSIGIGEPEKIFSTFGYVGPQSNVSVKGSFQVGDEDAYAVILKWKCESDIDLCIKNNDTYIVGCESSITGGPLLDFYPKNIDDPYIIYTGYNNKPEIVMIYSGRRYSRRGSNLTVLVVNHGNSGCSFTLIYGKWSRRPKDIDYIFSTGDISRADFEIYIDKKEHEVEVGKSVSYRISLKNTGTRHIFIKMRYNNPHISKSWFIAFSDDRFILRQGEKKDIIFQIIPKTISTHTIEIIGEEQGGLRKSEIIKIAVKPAKRRITVTPYPTPGATSAPATPTPKASEPQYVCSAQRLYLGEIYGECCICESSGNIVPKDSLCQSKNCKADCSCQKTEVKECVFGSVRIPYGSSYGCCICSEGNIIFESSLCSGTEYCSTATCKCESGVIEEQPVEDIGEGLVGGASTGGGLVDVGDETTSDEGTGDETGSDGTQEGECCIWQDGMKQDNGSCSEGYSCDLETCQCVAI